MASRDSDKETMFRKYNKRSGTVDHGKEYEVLMCMWYAIKFILDDHITKFEMSSNVAEAGDFDDICIDVEFKNLNTVRFLLQLKHSENKRRLVEDQLSGTGKGNFALEKYFNTIGDIKSEWKVNNMMYVIFTNNSVVTQFDKLSEQFRIDTEFEYFNLLNTHSRGNVVSFQKKNEKINFLTDQSNTIEIENKLKDVIRKQIKFDIYEKLKEYVKNWWQGKFFINKNDVMLKLIELVSSTQIICPLSDELINAKTKYLTEALTHLETNVIFSGENPVICKIWPIANIEVEKKGQIKGKFLLNSDSNLSNKILWYLDKLPLIIKVRENARDDLKIFEKFKVNNKIIILGEGTCDNFPITEKIRQNFKVSICGRPEISLQELSEIDEKFLSLIGLNKLVTMTQSTLSIGEKNVNLPENHIPRKIFRINLDFQDLIQYINSSVNKLIVINFTNSGLKAQVEQQLDIVQVNDFLMYDKDEQKKVKALCGCSDHQFNILSQNYSQILLFEVHNFNDVSVVRAKGDINDLLKFQRPLEEAEVISGIQTNLNVICAAPGMGKSTFLKSLDNFCPLDVWPLHIDLIKCNQIFSTNLSYDTILEELFKLQESNNDLESKFQQLYRKNHKIYIFLDGLDELKNENVPKVLNFAKYLSSINYKVWIASRENLREEIIEHLNIIPIEIKGLLETEQEKYIHERLGKVYDKIKIEKIKQLIFHNVHLNNSRGLLGIPLQLYILTQIFLENPSNDVIEKGNFVLTNMYKIFFKGRIKFEDGKSGIPEDTRARLGQPDTRKYEIMGLKTCLEETDFKIVNLTLDDIPLREMKQKGDNLGIVRVDSKDEIIFTHQTYAEYFAALWFTKHQDHLKLLRDDIFNKKYDNLRKMFDIMLAEKNALHLAVIYQNFEQFKLHLDKLNEKDKGGRNIMHLLCCYGNKYEKGGSTPKENEDYKEMFDLILNKNFNVLDKLLGLDCFGYAINSRCLYAIDQLLKINQSFVIMSNLYKIASAEELLQYCLKNKCGNLLEFLNRRNGYIHKRIDVLGHSWLNKYRGIYDKTPLHVALKKMYPIEAKNLIKNGTDLNIQDQNGNTPLHVALENGKLKLAKLIANEADLDIPNEIGLTPLHVACNYGHLELVKYLIGKGADFNMQTENGSTALHVALTHGNSEIGRYLIEKGADLHVANKDGNGVLHLACFSKRSNNLIPLLVNKGLSINAQNNYGATPLHFLLQKGNLEMTKYLVERGGNVKIENNTGDNALHGGGLSEDILEYLLSMGLSINSQNDYGVTPLHWALQEGDSQTAKFLIQKGADINIENKMGDTPLHIACASYSKNINLVEYLLEHGAELNVQDKNGKTPLHLALKSRNTQVVKYLIKHGADLTIPDKFGNTALHKACCLKDKSLWKDLLTRDSPLNAQNNYGKTPLHCALENQNSGMVEFLIEKGADLNIQDRVGNIELHQVCLSYSIDRNAICMKILKTLLRNRSFLNAQNKNGKTTLHLALEKGNTEVAQFLIKQGADLNLQDQDGNIALHKVCLSNSCDTTLLECLLKNSSSINTQNNNGTIPLHIAVWNGNLELVEYLVEKGADLAIPDNEGDIALHNVCCCESKDTNVIEYLLRKDSLINAQNNAGRTPLLFALEEGRSELVKCLVEHGADLSIPDRQGNTALDIAWKKGNWEMRDFLIQKGAN